MVENKMEGCLHPGKLVMALLQKVQALGVQVITGIEVMNYHENDHLVSIITNYQVDFLLKIEQCSAGLALYCIPSDRYWMWNFKHVTGRT